MIDTRELLRRSLGMMASAESMPGAPGAAGLAYQAANLAMRALLVEVDGTDIWQYEKKNERVAELLDIPASDIALIHHVRQLDFYGDTGFGGETALPTAEECDRALKLARRVIDAVVERIPS